VVLEQDLHSKHNSKNYVLVIYESHNHSEFGLIRCHNSTSRKTHITPTDEILHREKQAPAKLVAGKMYQKRITHRPLLAWREW